MVNLGDDAEVSFLIGRAHYQRCNPPARPAKRAADLQMTPVRRPNRICTYPSAGLGAGRSRCEKLPCRHDTARKVTTSSGTSPAGPAPPASSPSHPIKPPVEARRESRVPRPARSGDLLGRRPSSPTPPIELSSHSREHPRICTAARHLIPGRVLDTSILPRYRHLATPLSLFNIRSARHRQSRSTVSSRREKASIPTSSPTSHHHHPPPTTPTTF